MLDSAGGSAPLLDVHPILASKTQISFTTSVASPYLS